MILWWIFIYNLPALLQVGISAVLLKQVQLMLEFCTAELNLDTFYIYVGHLVLQASPDLKN